MNNKNIICGLCENEIHCGEPRFYFPVLPSNHPLADIKGILHISCLIAIDTSRRIGQTLAEITEDIARCSESVPFMSRQGNIVLRNRQDEKRIEILDFEDFCEISIPHAILGKLQVAIPGESIALGMQTLHVKENMALSVEFKSPFSVVDLRALNLNQLLLLLG